MKDKKYWLNILVANVTNLITSYLQLLFNIYFILIQLPINYTTIIIIISFVIGIIIYINKCFIMIITKKHFSMYNKP